MIFVQEKKLFKVIILLLALNLSSVCEASLQERFPPPLPIPNYKVKRKSYVEQEYYKLKRAIRKHFYKVFPK